MYRHGFALMKRVGTPALFAFEGTKAVTSVKDRNNKAARTSEIAFGIIDAEAAAREAKSAKLRKLREAREAAAAPAADKPVAKKRAIVRKPRRVGP
jgi:hypothetical protein